MASSVDDTQPSAEDCDQVCVDNAAVYTGLIGVLESFFLLAVLEHRTSKRGVLSRTSLCWIVQIRVFNVRRSPWQAAMQTPTILCLTVTPTLVVTIPTKVINADGKVWGKSNGRRCSCTTVLAVHADVFRRMKRQGGELKKRYRYTPKGVRSTCFKNVKQHNKWLLANIIEPSGNYLYCRRRKVKSRVKPLSHDLTAKSSNRSVPEVKQQFLEFVDYSLGYPMDVDWEAPLPDIILMLCIPAFVHLTKKCQL